MTEDSELRKIRKALQDLKDSQDMLFSWVKGLDDEFQAKFAQLDDIDERLIQIQRHEYKLLRDEIDDIKRRLPDE